jgi:hypothetical protein
MAIEQYIKQFVWKDLARQNADNPDEPMMPIDNTSYYTFMSKKENRDWLKETAAPLQVYAGLNWDVLPLLWEFEDDVLYASRSEPFTYRDFGYDTSMKMGETGPVPNNPDDFNRLFASGLIDEHGNWLTPLGADQPIDWDRFYAGTTVLQQ